MKKQKHKYPVGTLFKSTRSLINTNNPGVLEIREHLPAGYYKVMELDWYHRERVYSITQGRLKKHLERFEYKMSEQSLFNNLIDTYYGSI